MGAAEFKPSGASFQDGLGENGVGHLCDGERCRRGFDRINQCCCFRDCASPGSCVVVGIMKKSPAGFQKSSVVGEMAIGMDNE